MKIDDRFERHDEPTRKFLAAILAVKEEEINERTRAGMGPIASQDWTLALAKAVWEAACWEEPTNKFIDKLLAFENDEVLLVSATKQ